MRKKCNLLIHGVVLLAALSVAAAVWGSEHPALPEDGPVVIPEGEGPAIPGEAPIPEGQEEFLPEQGPPAGPPPVFPLPVLPEQPRPVPGAITPEEPPLTPTEERKAGPPAPKPRQAPTVAPGPPPAKPPAEAPAEPAAGGVEKIPIQIDINTGPVGLTFVGLTPEGDVLISVEDMLQLGFQNLPQGVDIDGEPHISLRSLAPDVSFELDMGTATVQITADPTLLRAQLVDLSRKPAQEFGFTRSNSAYFNYSVGYSVGDDQEFNSLRIPYEIAARLGSTLFFSSFSYSRSKGVDSLEENSLRLLSNATWDLPESLVRIVLGDITATSGQLGSSGVFGGLSVATNFSFRPFLVRYPQLDVAGLLETPSRVDLYVNDRLTRREDLAPGPFEFRNLPAATGLGDVTLVITDAFGRERRIDIPFFVSTNLLRAGLNEFRYGIGVRREALGEESDQYGDAALLAFHRLGLTDWFTGGLRVEAGGSEATGNEVVNFGPTATAVFGRAGQLDFALAYSRERGATDEEEFSGRGGFLAYSLPTRFVSFSLSGSGFTRNYSNLSLSPSDDKARRSRSASLGFNLGLLGSLSLRYAIAEPYLAGDTTTGSVLYSLGLGGGVNFNASGTQTRTILNDVIVDDSISLFAGLSVSFGESHSASLTRQQQEDQLTAAQQITDSFSLQKSAPLSNGFGYQLSAQRTRFTGAEKSRSGTVFLRYNGPYGVYSTTHRRFGVADNTDINIAGGISLIDGSLHISRPIRDAFALVRLADLENVRVYFHGQEVATTDSQGEAVVPDLSSYLNNRIRIENVDVPIEYQLSGVEAFAAPYFRSGAVVTFEATKLQAFIGILFYREKGEKFPAEYMGLAIDVAGAPLELIVGKGGEFYVENLPPATYPARIFSKKRTCRFDLVVPVSEDVMVDLGEVICEMD